MYDTSKKPQLKWHPSCPRGTDGVQEPAEFCLKSASKSFTGSIVHTVACTKFNHKDTLDWKARLEAPDGSVFVQIKLSMFSKALKREPRDKAVCANHGSDLAVSF